MQADVRGVIRRERGACFPEGRLGPVCLIPVGTGCSRQLLSPAVPEPDLPGGDIWPAWGQCTRWRFICHDLAGALARYTSPWRIQSKVAERENGLLIPRRGGPLRFAGPIENHVELVRRRAFIAPDHEEPLAVRRGLVVREAVIVQEEGGPIKKSARRAEGTV